MGRKKHKYKSVPAMIRLPVDACLTAPYAQLDQDLREASVEANRALNLALQGWLSYHREHPEVRVPGPEGLARENRMPPELEKQMRMEAAVYAPHLSSGLLSRYVQAADAALGARVPWDYDMGDEEFRWQAMLEGKLPLFTRRSKSIEFRAQELAVCWEGNLNGGSVINSSGVRRDMLKCGHSSCVVRVPLFSRKSGRAKIAHIVRINLQYQSKGNKKILRKITSGEWVIGGSSIAPTDKGWEFRLSYDHPVKSADLDPERTAILRPGPKSHPRHPFQLILPDGTVKALGFGHTVVMEYSRQESKRKNIQRKHRTTGGAKGKGKGRKRYMKAYRPHSRRIADLHARFRGSMLTELLRVLKDNDCGRLIYREPTKKLRERDWWAERRTPFDWGAMGRDVQRLARRNEIVYPKPNTKNNPRIGTPEFFSEVDPKKGED